MVHQSLEKQQEALKGLKTFLEEFVNDLKDKIDHYKKRVEELHGEGLSNEVYNKYSSDNYSRDKDYIHSLIKHIEDTDIPYINRNIGATEENIGTASGATSRGWDSI